MNKKELVNYLKSLGFKRLTFLTIWGGTKLYNTQVYKKDFSKNEEVRSIGIFFNKDSSATELDFIVPVKEPLCEVVFHKRTGVTGVDKIIKEILPYYLAKEFIDLLIYNLIPIYAKKQDWFKKAPKKRGLDI